MKTWGRNGGIDSNECFSNREEVDCFPPLQVVMVKWCGEWVEVMVVTTGASGDGIIEV